MQINTDIRYLILDARSFLDTYDGKAQGARLTLKDVF
jgi:hypothetical protein